MSTSNTAASLLRELRQKQGNSLRSAAADIGIAPSQLSRLERGERTAGDELAQKISEYYHVSAEVINLSQGLLPDDVVQILRAHPEEILRLREKYSG